MLHAILLNKAGRNISSSELHWRQVFKASEDSLTSTVFGTLLYLPTELFWSILGSACYQQKITSQSPRILSVEFWPRWRVLNAEDVGLVEPDVFIRTHEFDLIVEAKRRDDNQQMQEQWNNEMQGYLNEYLEDKKKVIFLAIGGIVNESPEYIVQKGVEMLVLKCRWGKLLDEIKRTYEKLISCQGYINNIDSVLAVLGDLIKGFGIHGYINGKWLEEENFGRISIDSYYSSIECFGDLTTQ